ncbi:MAG TPA: GNAT family N-acetyltransferase, partial [Longimicrobium sp.]|uniref:GNAT family N-acetyltransferase n=1 Tax=Longimicrobium sp. TaxID=2029185 RepID=UPI002ED85F75
MAGESDLRLVTVDDERLPLATRALELIVHSIGDVQPVEDLLTEIEERRRGMPMDGSYHLLAMVDPAEHPVAAAAGVYLKGVNAGFITYLAVRQDQRGRELGRALRTELVEAMRTEARESAGRDLDWVVGEVRRESPWLRTLVSHGAAIPFDMPYFHPWQSRRTEGRYVLYREPVADARAELPPDEVARLLYNIYRRAYRVRFPLQSDTFGYMLRKLEGRESV